MNESKIINAILGNAVNIFCAILFVTIVLIKNS